MKPDVSVVIVSDYAAGGARPGTICDDCLTPFQNRIIKDRPSSGFVRMLTLTGRFQRILLIFSQASKWLWLRSQHPMS